jgi:uncharacterized protein (DUF342 family)
VTEEDQIIKETTAEDLREEVLVRLFQEGVFLKVKTTAGSNLKEMEAQALREIERRGALDLDRALVSKVVRRGDDQYVQVGSFDYNPANDAVLSAEIMETEMKAFMEVRSPGLGGADLVYENMVAGLKNRGVLHGIKEEVLKRFEDHPQYETPVLAAEGTAPVNGADARIIYNFKFEQEAPVLREKNGKIDFKDLNLVENVVAGQLLAKKVPAEEGTPGQTVTGKMLPAKEGKNTKIDVGKNVKLSEDGMTATAEINGQVLLIADKINVEPILTISGDVNMHVGNTLFLGTVIVKGNVEDGFSIKASGNIEVVGNVGKSVLDAEGDIVVHQGILGKTGGKIRCGGSVFAKFIEHANVESGQNVVVSEGIIHSTVDANSRIICHGKRASIVGGRLRATSEINAKNLGSVAGAETILEVGYDPKSKERLVELEEANRSKVKDIEEIELNIKTLTNLAKVQKTLPEDKANYLQELNEKRSVVLAEIKEVQKEMAEIKFRLASVKREGKVSASDKVFSGVRVFIKDSNLEVRNEFKSVTFILEQNNIRVTKYEPVEEDLRRKV